MSIRVLHILHTNINEKLSLKFVFITLLKFYIAFSKHGSVWNPIKRLYLALKRDLLLLQAEEAFSGTVLKPFFLMVLS